MTFKYQSGKVI